MSYNTVVLLLGSNINNPEKNIETALSELDAKVGLILTKSKLILTKPVEFDSNNFFCNIAVKIKTQFSPIKLLKAIKSIEMDMGRVKDSSYYGTYKDRIIDIDIIIFNNLKFISGRLTVPHHKNLFERDFAKTLINDVK